MIRFGAPIKEARAVLLLVHGRGASTEDIRPLGEAVMAGSGDLAAVAPQASGNTWYPYPFMSPIAQNEPHLTNALTMLAETIEAMGTEGVPPERIFLIGFSQGGCLVTEFAARNAQRYGGVAGLSGGLIGDKDTPRDYTGNLAGTPVLLGCSDVDPHIPLERVQETARVLEALGANVTTRIYYGMEHTINDDELVHLRDMVKTIQ